MWPGMTRSAPGLGSGIGGKPLDVVAARCGRVGFEATAGAGGVDLRSAFRDGNELGGRGVGSDGPSERAAGLAIAAAGGMEAGRLFKVAATSRGVRAGGRATAPAGGAEPANGRNASTNSATVWKRSSGFFFIKRSTMAVSSTDTSGFNSRIGVGSLN